MVTKRVDPCQDSRNAVLYTFSMVGMFCGGFVGGKSQFSEEVRVNWGRP